MGRNSVKVEDPVILIINVGPIDTSIYYHTVILVEQYHTTESMIPNCCFRTNSKYLSHKNSKSFKLNQKNFIPGILLWIFLNHLNHCVILSLAFSVSSCIPLPIKPSKRSLCGRHAIQRLNCGPLRAADHIPYCFCKIFWYQGFITVEKFIHRVLIILDALKMEMADHTARSED